MAFPHSQSPSLYRCTLQSEPSDANTSGMVTFTSSPLPTTHTRTRARAHTPTHPHTYTHTRTHALTDALRPWKPYSLLGTGKGARSESPALSPCSHSSQLSSFSQRQFFSSTAEWTRARWLYTSCTSDSQSD